MLSKLTPVVNLAKELNEVTSVMGLTSLTQVSECKSEDKESLLKLIGSLSKEFKVWIKYFNSLTRENKIRANKLMRQAMKGTAGFDYNWKNMEGKVSMNYESGELQLISGDKKLFVRVV